MGGVRTGSKNYAASHRVEGDTSPQKGCCTAYFWLLDSNASGMNHLAAVCPNLVAIL